MKTLKIFLSLALLSFIGYLISCDVVETDKSKIKNDIDFITECYDTLDRCPVPSYCNNSKGEHFCLYLHNGETDEEFEYIYIKKIIVTHENTSKDCLGNSYYCRYIIDGSGPTEMGCVSPWCSDSCVYTRSVCLITYGDVVYTGTRVFGHKNYSGCTVTVYQSDGDCDFGGIEINNN
jgi:hypothetical protein